MQAIEEFWKECTSLIEALNVREIRSIHNPPQQTFRKTFS